MKIKNWIKQNLLTLVKIYDASTANIVRLYSEKPLVLKILGDRLGRVAEIGCGDGFYTVDLLKKAEYVLAIDVQAQFINRLKTILNNYSNLTLIAADIEKITLPEKKFDTIICTQVLEHLDKDEGVVKMLQKALTPGGRMIISVPIPPEPLGFTKNIGPSYHKREGYSFRSICESLGKNKMKIGQYYYCTYWFSRLAIKLISFFGRYLPTNPPRVIIWFFVKLDSLLQLGKPYILVLEAIKEDE